MAKNELSKKQERFKVVVDLHLLLRRGDDILLGRRINTAYYNDVYHFPSGHMEPNESALDALARETKEEIGLVIDTNNARLIHVMHNSSSGGRLALFFELRTWTGEPTNMEPDKCAELKWFSINNPPKEMIPYAQYTLQAYKEGVLFSVYGW